MKTHLNLLPLSFQRRLVIRRELIRWGSGCLMALFISTLCCLDAHTSAQRKRTQLDRLTSQAVPVRKLSAENERLAKQLNLSHSRHLLLQSLEGVHPPLQIMGVVSRSANDDVGSVQVRNFALTPGATNRSQNSRRRGLSILTGTSSESTGQLSLQGIALDDVALTKFVNGLRSEGLFRSVELRSSSNLQLSLGSARQYSVECRF